MIVVVMRHRRNASDCGKTVSLKAGFGARMMRVLLKDEGPALSGVEGCFVVGMCGSVAGRTCNPGSLAPVFPKLQVPVNRHSKARNENTCFL